jgi:acyl-coenzyme A thioesterase PaaI-like protein
MSDDRGTEYDASWLNDRSEFQLNWVHGLRNSTGLHLQYDLEDDANAYAGVRVVSEWTPGPDHVGFPGFVHGGLLSAVLDDAMGRSTAIFKKWVVTGRMNVRYRSGAKVGQPLRLEAWITRMSRRLMTANSQLLSAEGELVAEADATYLPVPDAMMAGMVKAWPGFAEYVVQ